MRLLGLMLASCVAGAAPAQQAATTELWPELDVYWTPARHQRTLLELSGTSEREAAKKEATVGLFWPASDVDLYLARQENSRGEPARVNALGVTVKLYR